jgi:hypothetical protein
MLCSADALSQAETSRRNEAKRNAGFSPEREARRREIMLLLDEIRERRPTSAEIVSRAAAR